MAGVTKGMLWEFDGRGEYCDGGRMVEDGRVGIRKDNWSAESRMFIKGYNDEIEMRPMLCQSQSW